MVGSLITDAPHEDQYAIQKKWMRGSPFDPNNPARWTEMHSPDIIEILPEKAPIETVRGVSLYADNGLFSGDTESIHIDVFPTTERPSWATGIDVQEIVLPGTNYRTIIEGNAQKTGAAIRTGNSSVHIHVAVRGQSKWGAPGKFAAVYRIRWTGIPPSLSINVPSSVLHPNETERFTVNSGVRVQWSVAGDGFIDPDGTYHAPASICTDHPVTIGATATDGSLATATAVVWLRRLPSLIPAAAILEAGEAQRFTTGPPTYTLAWTVAGGDTNGTFDADGTYHAPAQLASERFVSVVASGVDSCGAFSLAARVLLIPLLGITPRTVTLRAGEHQQFRVTGASGRSRLPFATRLSFLRRLVTAIPGVERDGNARLPDSDFPPGGDPDPDPEPDPDPGPDPLPRDPIVTWSLIGDGTIEENETYVTYNAPTTVSAEHQVMIQAIDRRGRTTTATVTLVAN